MKQKTSFNMMTLIFAVIFSTVFTFACGGGGGGGSKSDDKHGPGKPGNAKVYVAGYYADPVSGNNKACYWDADGKRIDLEEPAVCFESIATSIAVSGGKVYVAGYYDTEDYAFVPNACYWVDGKRTDLTDDGGTNSFSAGQIFVSGDDVYVTGNWLDPANQRKVQYWKNGVKSTFSAPDPIYHFYTLSIFVSAGKVYTSGYYNDSSGADRAYYFVDNQGYELLPLAGDEYTDCMAESIFVSDGKTYVTGWYFYNASTAGYNDQPSKICYWVDGEIKILTAPADSSDAYVDSIFVSGGKVYAAGGYNDYVNYNCSVSCYWVDGERKDLLIEDEDWKGWYYDSTAYSIAVSGNDVYVAGIYDNFGDKACYWNNGTLVPLAGDEWSCTTSIAVVE